MVSVEVEIIEKNAYRDIGEYKLKVTSIYVFLIRVFKYEKLIKD